MWLPILAVLALGALYLAGSDSGRAALHLPARKRVASGTAYAGSSEADVREALEGLGMQVESFNGSPSPLYMWAWSAEVTGSSSKELPQTARFLRGGIYQAAVEVLTVS